VKGRSCASGANPLVSPGGGGGSEGGAGGGWNMLACVRPRAVGLAPYCLTPAAAGACSVQLQLVYRKPEAGRAVHGPRPCFLICAGAQVAWISIWIWVLNQQQQQQQWGGGAKYESKRWGVAPHAAIPRYAPRLPVLGAAAHAHGPGTRAASAAGRRPPVRCGGEADEPAPVPVGVTGHRTQRPTGQVAWPPRTTPSPTQLPPGPRERTVANIAAPGPSDRAAGRSASGFWLLGLRCELLLSWAESGERRARS
jgi:hypothetical protein